MLTVNALTGFGDILDGSGPGQLLPVTANLLTGSTSTGSWAGDTVVCKIPLSALTGSGTEWQLELKGAGAGSVIGDIYFGETASSGDAFDFKASPAPVLVGTGFNLNSGSPLTLTSAFSFTPSGTSALMISFNVGTGGILAIRENAGAGFVTYNRDAVQQASTVNKSTYTVVGTARATLVNRIFAR